MGKYDQSMKLLVAANPLAIVMFILHYAETHIQIGKIVSVVMLNTEFEGYELDADGLLLITTEDGEEILLHIEFQSRKDTHMPDRLLEYCLRARKKHGPLPIISCVIYLRKGGIVQEPPLCWKLRNGRKTLVFDFVCIKLWELTKQELFALNQPELLPLVLLTKDNVNRTMVKEVFQTLLDNRLQNVLPVAELLAALVLKSKDQTWLKQELPAMTELFKDSPAYGWMTESAREQAREEERQHALVQFQETVIALITRDFPRLAKLAKKQVSQVEDTGRLQQLILQVTLTRDASQVAALLVDLDEDEQETQAPLATEEQR